MSSTVICISASDGSNAAQVAVAAADALGYHVINEEIVGRAAAEAGVDQQAIVDVEHHKTVMAKIIDRLAPSGAARDPGFAQSLDAQITAGMLGVTLSRDSSPKRPSEELRGLIRSVIDGFTAAGDVVILEHAASQSLAGREHVLRVFVTASLATRSARVAESQQLSAKEAESIVKRGDAGRAEYLKRFYQIEHELPTHYDMVLNTDHMTIAEAAAAIVSVARAGA